MTKEEKLKLYEDWNGKMMSIPLAGRLSKLGEEASELASAIQKYIGITRCAWPDRRTVDEAYEKIINEAADVLNMLEAAHLTPETASGKTAERLARAIEFKRMRFTDRIPADTEDPSDVSKSGDDSATAKDGPLTGPTLACKTCQSTTCPIKRRSRAKASGDREGADRIKKRMNDKHGVRLLIVGSPSGTLGYTSCIGSAFSGGSNPWHDGISGDFE